MQIDSQGAAVASTATVATGVSIYIGAQSSQTGPIIAGAVAVIVALITWYATDRRQDAALEAERQRHRATLDAEQQRFETRLQHEREMQDVNDLREMLVPFMEAAEQAWAASADLLRRVDNEDASRARFKVEIEARL